MFVYEFWAVDFLNKTFSQKTSIQKKIFFFEKKNFSPSFFTQKRNHYIPLSANAPTVQPPQGRSNFFVIKLGVNIGLKMHCHDLFDPLEC